MRRAHSQGTRFGNTLEPRILEQSRSGSETSRFDAATRADRLTICCVCSHGGHLTEMLELMEAFEGHDTFFFCYDAETTRALPRAYRVPNRPRNPLEYGLNLVRAYRIFRKERPDMVVSTGAEIAIPVMLVAKWFRLPTVYIECGAQVATPSLTGRLMYWLADRFYVQWPELGPAYGPRAMFRGSLVDEERPVENEDRAEKRMGAMPSQRVQVGRSSSDQTSIANESGMIYATVGTMFLDFGRLVNALDAIAQKTGRRVVIQTGMGTTAPLFCEYFDFKPREEIAVLQREAAVIVAHAGVGSVIEALEARRPLVVCPRLKKYNEHLTDHQLELAEAVQRRGWGRMVLDMADLEDACLNPLPPPSSYEPAKHRLVAAVRETVEHAAAGKR
ncbi:MAG: PssD/Cps14F family polysaccharide biosynthesis glycosyltransferase [Candidatus Hydrogenedentota bacterium]